MKKASHWLPIIAWATACTAAGAFAWAAPDETAVMGRLPQVQATRLDQRPISLPEGLTADRTLTIVAFRRTQRAEVQSWIDGLKLRENRAIAWLRMPVINDPGEQRARRRVEDLLASRHAEHDHGRLVPVFTDREAFVRSVGLSGSDHASVLVLDRRGNVLARAEGAYDEEKGQALRETLLARAD